ncbi:synaptosomal-associated protein 25-like [Ostrea edulis]|uniref:synaptosomal-associated protein 25-like n=1 Tax=Ostrea edulis TaxID=37623 RepID=UPI0024AEB2E3|nr:synaptosomal-associated protein 25-like [Ostrea edulis]
MLTAVMCEAKCETKTKDGVTWAAQAEENKIQAIRTKCDQITDQSLESTRRMNDLLDEAKEAGIRALVLIDEQGEQMDRIEEGMDQVKIDMKDAEKSLEELRKCCGLCVLPWSWPWRWSIREEYEEKWNFSEDGKVNSDRLRIAAGKSVGSSSPIITRITNDGRENEMEENLTSVSSALSNLRNMALDMGSEIDCQNRQLDRINFKGKTNESRILVANQELQKSLKNT